MSIESYCMPNICLILNRNDGLNGHAMIYAFIHGSPYYNVTTITILYDLTVYLLTYQLKSLSFKMNKSSLLMMYKYMLLKQCYHIKNSKLSTNQIQLRHDILFVSTISELYKQIS